MHFPNMLFIIPLKMVTVHLAQDENTDCLGAWVSAKDQNLVCEETDGDQKGYV